jgi:hypothetical protein
MIQPTARLLHSIEATKKGLPTLAERALLLQHEVADVGYRIVRASRTPQDAKATMADIGVDLGDAMVQCQLLALDLGLVHEDVLALGLQHTWERFKDFWPGDDCE